MKLCLFTNVFAKAPLEDAIRAAAKNRFTAVELLVGWGANHLEHNTTETRVREIKRMTADAGLAVACIYTSLGSRAYLGADLPANRAEFDTLRSFCEKCKVLGCDLVRVGCGRSQATAGGDDAARRSADWLRGASEAAALFGMRVVVEIHFGQMVETAPQAAAMAARVARENFGVIFDPGNMFIAGADYGEAAVQRLGKHLFHVHVKDIKRGELATSPLVACGGHHFHGEFLGEGDVDYRAALRAVARAGYTGYLSCECMKKDDPWETARREAEALRLLLAEIAEPRQK
ncbi:MAG: sugar phosphate isomerase/epimerase [Verrucomicrobia bacterium]|nr:sugar phosphate isomerase/epimerase [Verrucomicrobiota bacterium]